MKELVLTTKTGMVIVRPENRLNGEDGFFVNLKTNGKDVATSLRLEEIQELLQTGEPLDIDMSGVTAFPIVIKSLLKKEENSYILSIDMKDVLGFNLINESAKIDDLQEQDIEKLLGFCNSLM